MPINEELRTLGENSAMGATYNSLERQRLDAPKCHPKTRVAVINRLISWAKGEIDFETLILWLYGAAGAGKSAIAQSLAEICEKYGRLLATFFFCKTAVEHSNIDRFVATIAYQIACAVSPLCPLIEEVLRHDPMIFHKSIDTQLLRLIIEPLQRLHSTGFDFKDSPSVIVIDGLDECQGTDLQSGILRSLVAAFRDSPLRIRILIASRPEVHLKFTFNSSSVHPHISRLALSDEYSAKEDIFQFLEDSFDKIRREHPLASYIPPSWPSVGVIHELTWKSSGQFIVASTTVKYVGGDPRQLPHRRLDVIRRLQLPKGEMDMPYAELNSLYHHVLSNVDDIEAVKQILGVLFIANLLGYHIDSIAKMDDFLSWQAGETKACLSQLASVIECDAYGNISILHASLSDFLLDPSRSQQFYLCRESVMGDCTALGLHHLCQEKLDECALILPLGYLIINCSSVTCVIPDYESYYLIVESCIDAGPLCTPRLQQQLSRLSFQTLYKVCTMYIKSYSFWLLATKIIKMLQNQVSFDYLCWGEILIK